jgi:hypothetical protein
MSTAPAHQGKSWSTHSYSILANHAWCPWQDSNLRSRLRRPGALVHCGLSVALPWLLPDHLCLRSPPRRVVKSTIDSASHDPVDSRRPYKKLATARITMDVCRIEDDLLLAFLRWTSKLVTALRMT